MRRSAPSGPFRKILVCQLRQIGDVLLCTPAISMLAAAWPEAEIHVLTEKKCTPVLEHNPHVAKVWAIDRKALNTIFRQLSFYREAGSGEPGGYDLVVDFQQLPRCRWVTLFAMLANPRGVRLTYTPPWYNRWLYTHWTRMRDGYAAMSKASVLEPLGLAWNGEPPRIWLTDAEKSWAAGYLAAEGLAEGELLVTVDPTHRRVTRRWPAAHFARLMDLAVEADPRLKFLLLYGPGEEEDAREVRAAMRRPERAILPERIISLREMAAVIAASALHLGNCSSPRHFATAVDTPTLIVRGATSGAWRYPADLHTDVAKGLDCQPCNRNACPRGDCACLTGLMPEEVLPTFLAKLPRA